MVEATVTDGSSGVAGDDGEADRDDGVDLLDGILLAAGGVLGLLTLVWGVLSIQLLLAALLFPVVVAVPLGVVAFRRIWWRLPDSDLDRFDGLAIGLVGVLGVLALGYAVLSQRILVGLAVVVLYGLVTALALVVRRLV